MTRPGKLGRRKLKISACIVRLVPHLAGKIVVNVTQVMVSSNRRETGAWVRLLQAVTLVAYGFAATAPNHISIFCEKSSFSKTVRSRVERWS
jgi:hypothetical protein